MKRYDENGNVVSDAKMKKPFYKHWWFIALVVVVIIGAIAIAIGVGRDNDDVATDTSEPEVEEVVVEGAESEEVEEPEEIEEESEPEAEKVVAEETEEVEEEDVVETEEDRDFRILQAENLAIEIFEGVAEVHYSEEKNAMMFLPTEEGFITDLVMIESGLLDKSSWDSLCDTFAEYSITLSEFTGDESILVCILNPANEDNCILLAMNGQIIYDVFK